MKDVNRTSIETAQSNVTFALKFCLKVEILVKKLHQIMPQLDGHLQRILKGIGNGIYGGEIHL